MPFRSALADMTWASWSTELWITSLVCGQLYMLPVFLYKGFSDATATPLHLGAYALLTSPTAQLPLPWEKEVVLSLWFDRR